MILMSLLLHGQCSGMCYLLGVHGSGALSEKLYTLASRAIKWEGIRAVFLVSRLLKIAADFNWRAHALINFMLHLKLR